MREVFADVPDTPTGRVVQVHTAARLLHRAEHHPDLAGALRQHIQPLIGGLPYGSDEREVLVVKYLVG